MTYEELLQQAPLSSQAGDRHAAGIFVELITQYLSRHGSTLTLSQKNYLYKARNTWRQRAAGHDPQWEQYGSKPGRRPTGRKTTMRAGRGGTQIDKTAYGDEHELDPLIVTIKHAFGRRG